ncbi:MAG TPA: hypothetical protein PL031_08195, partial [Neisseria sp.]|nr:hypothetical protein [Neisseria sp.]
MGFMSFSKIFDSMAPTLAGWKSLAAALRGGSLIGNLNLRIIRLRRQTAKRLASVLNGYALS